MKHLAIQEFRARGYLQELNRRFLHPLGLALEVVREDDGTERLGGVWDARADPEGIAFDDYDSSKAAAVDAEIAARRPARVAALGYWVQGEMAGGAEGAR